MKSLNSLDELKKHIIQNTKLEDLIKEDAEIRKHGNRLVACCPFHEENTPSFYIFSDHYHCFGCKAHGDVINYVREKKGLGFIEALEFLGGRLGLNCEQLHQNKSQKQAWQKKRRQTQAFHLAQGFFASNLMTEEGREAFNYIKNRGYSNGEIKRFEFGFAPASSQRLSQFLQRKGFSGQELEDYSLANVHRNQAFDFFRNRLMIPVRDIHGGILAFGGRTLSKDESYQKYKNSRYDKRQVLFGLNQAYKAMKKQGRVFVVEGYLDAVRLWSRGLDETVACQGTTLTQEHINLLKPLTKQVFLLFDGDKAGESSALNLIETSLAATGLSFYYIQLPQGEDPDSFIQKYGPEALENLASKAPSLIEFVIQKYFSQTPEQGIPGLLREKLLPWLAQIKDPLESAYLLKKIAEISGLSQQILQEQLRKLKPTTPRTKQGTPKATEVAKHEKLIPYVFDLLGHTYLMEPGEGQNLQTLKRLRSELDLIEPWNSFFDEMLSCLEQEKLSPCKKPSFSWLSACTTEIKNFILRMEKDKMAFVCSDRSIPLGKILRAHEAHLTKKKIAFLKEKMKQEPGNSQFFSEIQDLYRKLSLTRANPS